MTALVHNTEHKQKTGKSMLSDAELHTLTQGWAARMGETNEYNRYPKSLASEGSMRMDATMFLYCAELSASPQSASAHILPYADTKRMKGIHNDEIMRGITEEEGLRFALAHTYLEYRFHVLHAFTFENLPLEVRRILHFLMIP